MKSKFITHGIVAALLVSGLLFAGCEFDNYDPPSSELTGEVTYQGEALGVKANEVELELWQPGFDFDEKIPVYLDQNGSYSAVLFDGTYRLTLFNGPWVTHSDSISFELRGQEEIGVEVEPYYIINNASISQSGGTVQATFNVGEVNTSQALDYVGLYVSTTNIVDRINSEADETMAEADIPTLDDPINLSVDLPDHLAGRDYIFARIGVKTVGIAELIYSQVVRIDL